MKKMDKSVSVVNFNEFISNYMDANEDEFKFMSGDIQIYPLSMASKFLRAPSPLFRTQYNFLLLFTKGGGTQQIDNDNILLKENDVLFIREGHLNAVKSISSNTDGYYIHISNSALEQILEEQKLLNLITFNPKHQVSKDMMHWLGKCSELILSQLNQDKSNHRVIIYLLRAIFLKLSESWPKAETKHQRKSEIVLLFKALLYRYFKSHREVKFYADQLSISENYLNRCIKEVTKKAPKRYINEMVINHSKILIQESSKNISEIAIELNFSEPSYFGRLFKSVVGIAPSTYRTSYMQGLSD